MAPAYTMRSAKAMNSACRSRKFTATARITRMK